MKARDTTRLETESFDVLVIGGGIYGAWTAYDASLRGLATALVEKSDWAAGTSSASSKLIHGGLRYLEQYRFGLVKKSLDERKRLAGLAPHRVSPMRFLVPLYRGDRVGRFRLRLGLLLYGLLAGRDILAGNGESLSPDEVLSRCPLLHPSGLQGGFFCGDCVTDDARFTLEIVDGACHAGAAAVNYVEAESLLENNGRVVGASVRDRLSSKTFDIHAKVVVNTAGPWAGRLSGKKAWAKHPRLTKGVHLVLPPIPDCEAMLIFTRSDKRVLFVFPWYGRTILGTTDTDYAGEPDGARVEAADVDYLLGEAGRVLASRGWNEASVLGSFVGIRALRDQPGVTASLLSREWAVESPQPGLLVSIGGKFTSARADAAEIVRRVMNTLGKKPAGRAPTQDRRFPWEPLETFDTWYAGALEECLGLGLDAETAATSVRRYGSTVAELLEIIRERPELTGRIFPDLPFSKAEIVHAARHEMVLTLEDLLRRRVPVLILNPPSKEILEQAVSLAAPVLDWTPERGVEEIEAVIHKYGRR